MENSKLISKILKKKKLQKISNDSLAIIIPGSWINAMSWNRDVLFSLEFHPLNKEIIIKEYEKISDIESKTD